MHKGSLKRETDLLLMRESKLMPGKVCKSTINKSHDIKYKMSREGEGERERERDRDRERDERVNNVSECCKPEQK